MIISKDIYTDNKIKRPYRQLRLILKGKVRRNIYMVCFINDTGKLEIYPTLQFRQKKMRELNLMVIGLFASMKDATEFICRLTDISLESKCDFDYRQAFNIFTKRLKQI